MSQKRKPEQNPFYIAEFPYHKSFTSKPVSRAHSHTQHTSLSQLRSSRLSVTSSSMHCLLVYRFVCSLVYLHQQLTPYRLTCVAKQYWQHVVNIRSRTYVHAHICSRVVFTSVALVFTTCLAALLHSSYQLRHRCIFTRPHN